MQNSRPDRMEPSGFEVDQILVDFLDDAGDPWAASYNEMLRERDLAYAQLFRTTSDMRQVLAQRDSALESLTKAHHQTLFKLALAAEYKDGDTGTHIVRLGRLSEIVARHLGQDDAYARLLRLAAPMHDIGKIGVPDAILKKPGPLTPDEWKIMRQHPEIGARILGHNGIPVFELAAEVALTHHEKWDGSGYPAGLASRAIPLSARIVALVDFFDALTMDRVYRPRLEDDEAIGLLAEQRGRHFDPAIVDVFLDCVDEIVAAREDVNSRSLAIQDLLGDGYLL